MFSHLGDLPGEAEVFERGHLRRSEALLLVRLPRVSHPLAQPPVPPVTPRHQAVPPLLLVPAGNAQLSNRIACVAALLSTITLVTTSNNRHTAQ
jgi:hypothetical protein